MGSRELLVLNAVKSALDVAGPITGTARPTGLVTYQMREHPVQADAVAMIIWPLEEAISFEVASSAQNNLQFAIEGRVAFKSGSAAAAIDPLLTWMWKAIMADITLGGVCSRVLPTRKKWDLKEQADQVAAAAMTFEAVFLTAYNDPEIAA